MAQFQLDFTHNHNCDMQGSLVQMDMDTDLNGYVLWPKPLCSEPGPNFLTPLTPASTNPTPPVVTVHV